MPSPCIGTQCCFLAPLPAVLVVQVIMATAKVFLTDYRHLSILWFVACLLIVYLYLRWMPMTYGASDRGNKGGA